MPLLQIRNSNNFSSEAWGLIERGDYEPGRFRLLEARKVNREDPRIDFSLGLLDGLINHDWLSAEKRFADCVRRYPENVPMLNNLAIAQLHNRREMEAVKRWKAIVEMNAANVEVVQNLGRARQLLEQGAIRRTTSLVKALDELYTDAAVATSQSFQGKSGFIVMSMQLADGRIVGWVNARKMEDSISVCQCGGNFACDAVAICDAHAGAARPRHDKARYHGNRDDRSAGALSKPIPGRLSRAVSCRRAEICHRLRFPTARDRDIEMLRKLMKSPIQRTTPRKEKITA